MSWAIHPGQGLGFMVLGSSLQSILSTIKSEVDTYPSIDVHYSPIEPVTTPVSVTLKDNGLRLRFDGADQRLRLIEVLDFRKCRLIYKGSELVKSQDDGQKGQGPAFKRVYQIFGASYPGEYIRPSNREASGTYVLSWQGLAFAFPLRHDAYAPKKDHVSLLGSGAAGPAKHMAIFEGSSWPEARNELYIRSPTGSRLSVIPSKAKDIVSPAELDMAIIKAGDGRIDLARRAPASPFTIALGQTTPQALITELGPPDATHKRIEKAEPREATISHKRTGSATRTTSNGRHSASQPSSYSSTGTDTFDTDFSASDAEDDAAERSSREVFWCYFSHGIDVLTGPPSNSIKSVTNGQALTPLATSPHLVVTKVVLHGNIPGSYAFNRHRRLRWLLPLPATSGGDLTSEDNFETIKPALMDAFAGVWPEQEMGRGKVVNRTWGGDPSDSTFFLPDAGEDLVEGGGSEQWLGNTRLYTYPGLVFEVLESGVIGGVTVH